MGWERGAGCSIVNVTREQRPPPDRQVGPRSAQPLGSCPDRRLDAMKNQAPACRVLRQGCSTKLKGFKLPTGALHHTVVETGDHTMCTFVTWKEEQDLANARPEMISFLDSIRDLLEELSPELGVTDPVSGPVIHHDS